jgi:hypothetical protein
MSGTGEIPRPVPRVPLKGTAGKPAPKPGHHPLGGAHIDTVVSDTGGSHAKAVYQSQQDQQLQDKGGQ